MNTNGLEQFIQENRAAFDQATPPAHVWAQLDQRLGRMETDALSAFFQQNRADFDSAEPSIQSWLAIEKQLDQHAAPHDPLTHFVQTHREAFDSATPAFRVWSNIDKTLHPTQTVRHAGILSIRHILRVAASVLLLLAVGATAGIYITKAHFARHNTIASLSDISPEYAEMVRYYNRQIEDKVRQVSMYDNKENVLDDLAAIDRAMQELEAELRRVPRGAEEQIISNLIKSYQIKMEILERVLNSVQHVNKDVNQLNSKDDEINI